MVSGTRSDGLTTHGVAAGQRVGQEPEGDHAREIEGGDDGAHAHRLAQHHLVDARGDVLGDMALQQVWDAAGDFDVLNGALQLAARFIQGLAAFQGDQARQVLAPLFQHAFHGEQVLDALMGGVRRQAGKAWAAACTARSTSALDESGTLPNTSWVAGLTTSSSSAAGPAATSVD